MLDADEAKLTSTGTLTITDSDIYVDGFSGQGTTCRDVVALACVWGIGKLQAELLATLQAPGGGIAGIGGPEPLDILRLKSQIEDLQDYAERQDEAMRTLRAKAADECWVSGYLKPANRGVYQCKLAGSETVLELEWTGSQWRRGAPWNHVAGFGLTPGDRWRAARPEAD